MRSSNWTCDNYCGAKRVGADNTDDLAPIDWTSLVCDRVAWTFCSRRCLIEFLFKSKMSYSLGTQVKADLIGERVPTTEVDAIVATGA